MSVTAEGKKGREMKRNGRGVTATWWRIKSKFVSRLI